MTCIICQKSYSVINTIMGVSFAFFPHDGMCAGCEERWRKSPEAKAQLDAYGRYLAEVKSLVQQHREKRELTPFK